MKEQETLSSRGKVDVRPMRRAEIGNLEARRLFSNVCNVHKSQRRFLEDTV